MKSSLFWLVIDVRCESVLMKETNSQPHILFVEDDPKIAAVMLRLLATWNYNVVHTSTVAAAISALDSQWFDLLVSDIGLPDGTGRQVMEHARDRFALCGIAISAYGMTEDLASNKQAGFETTLVKPASLKAIEHAIKNCLGAQPAH